MLKPALGRGLGALLAGSPAGGRPPASAVSLPVELAPQPVDDREHVERVALSRIQPSPFQPRKDFSEEALTELADSIREQGILQPLIVRARNGHLELIAGERRWRAAQILNLAEVPVIVREADDRTVAELALIENLQRENLNALEEAQGYFKLIGQFQLTQEEVATKVGKSRAVVANALRLLKLPPPVQDYLRMGRLSVGHAKVILGLPDERQQELAAERVLKDGMNVRQTEGLVAKWQAPVTPHSNPAAAPAKQNTHISHLEGKLRERLGTRIHLRYQQGKGALEIAFFSDDELERLLQILGVNAD